MPGLFGFVRDLDAEQSAALTARLAQAQNDAPRFRCDLYHQAGFGFGRVSLGLFNPEPQPVWAAGGQVGLVLEGELYDTEPLRQALAARGAAPAGPSHAELLLALYLAEGAAFLPRLNGSFALAIWDARTQALLLANDRLGTHPLYYALAGGGLVFGSGVRVVLADPAVPRRIDHTAMAEFLTFDHALHARTLVEDVHLLPQATALTFQAGRARLERYWELRYPSTYPFCSEADYLAELAHHLRRAVARQNLNHLPSALMLSGGLDSRLLLGLLAEARGRALKTFTWGIAGCDEARYAQEAARQVGAEHHFFRLGPEWVGRLAERAVRLTDGLGNVVNLHALANLDEEAQHAQVVYKGYLGDAMFGFALRPRFWADYDDETRIRQHLEAYRDYNVLSFDLPVHGQLFTDSFRRAVGDGVVADYARAVNEAQTPQLANQRLYADYTQRVPRMTTRGVEVTRDRLGVRLPFADNDLVEFSTRLPPGLLMGRQLITRAFVEAFPKLAQVPVTPSGLPAVACAREVRLRAEALVKWHLRKRGLGRLAGPASRPYKDYNGWFRRELRGWVEATLLSPRALERGYFQPDYVRRLVAEHMAGTNHAVRLGGLLAIELWHRQFMDSTPA
jgi:asparagine synthase (glutamine-hydrolysing)